jgi:uncharacterized protein
VDVPHAEPFPPFTAPAERREPSAALMQLSLDEARGVLLAAQGLYDPPSREADAEAVGAVVERLGAVQLDAINVVARSPYLVLWSRLGPFEPALLDAALWPGRAVFEYWSHAASIVPMADYAYYRPRMLAAREHMWRGIREWMEANPGVLRSVLDAIRDRGPMASADFERPADGRRAAPWDWYGPKATRRALDALWSMGELMVHSRRAGQKVYDLRERVLAEAFGAAAPRDDELPSPAERLEHFARRTARALGVVTPSWLRDYFRLPAPRRDAGAAWSPRDLLDALAREGAVVPAAVHGLAEPAYVARESLAALERIRAGARPARTTLLSPFDSVVWDRARARALFGYDVCFEAYVVPHKRRFGYYCLAILHDGRLVGRLDPKVERTAAGRRLLVRALFLEPGVAVDDGLVAGLAGALQELARFVGAERVSVGRGARGALAAAVRKRLAGRAAGGSS